MKIMEVVRDELANEYWKEHTDCSSPVRLNSVASYKVGFDACREYYEKEVVKDLVDALEQYADMDNWCNYDDSGCAKDIGQKNAESWYGKKLAPEYARQALKRHYEKVRDNE